jgi:hypothetical protein
MQREYRGTWWSCLSATNEQVKVESQSITINTRTVTDDLQTCAMEENRNSSVKLARVLYHNRRTCLATHWVM